ncbi:MAG: ABC transporter permease subunit [Solirubrobacterales bacterium]
MPGTLKEAAHALGIARWRTTVRIALPTAAGGLITGSLLAVARVAGETAPLIFLSSIFAPGVLTEPGQALASILIFIFQASESPKPEAHWKPGPRHWS